jgi:hypothetical protein
VEPTDTAITQYFLAETTWCKRKSVVDPRYSGRKQAFSRNLDLDSVCMKKFEN